MNEITVDIERLNVAERLLNLADAYRLEADCWPDPGSQLELHDSTRALAHLARLVLRGIVTLEHAEAFITAGGVVLHRVQGARKLAEQITHDRGRDADEIEAGR